MLNVEGNFLDFSPIRGGRIPEAPPRASPRPLWNRPLVFHAPKNTKLGFKAWVMNSWNSFCAALTATATALWGWLTQAWAGRLTPAGPPAAAGAIAHLTGKGQSTAGVANLETPSSAIGERTLSGGGCGSAEGGSGPGGLEAPFISFAGVGGVTSVAAATAGNSPVPPTGTTSLAKATFISVQHTSCVRH